MMCTVCFAPNKAGLTSWHAVCEVCGYEAAALKPTINKQTTGAAVDEDERELGLKALRQENFRDIVNLIRARVAPGAQRLLDVGCAHGWFLEVARDHFDVLGVEPDALVGGRTSARGLPVRHGYFPEALTPDEKFDVIVFNDVFEHIPDIASALKACYEHLSKDGLLVLNLPNSNGFFYRISKLLAKVGWRSPFERLWQKDLPSPHLHYFNPSNLGRLVTKDGFEQIYTGELPSLRVGGLLERIRCAGNISGIALYVQYVAVLCSVPLLRSFPSDIIIGVFRKKTQQAS